MCNQLKEADPSAMSDLFFINLSDKLWLCRGKSGILPKHSNFDMMLLKALQCILYSIL